MVVVIQTAEVVESNHLQVWPGGYVRVSETGSWPRTKAHLKLVAPDQGQDDIADLVGVPANQH